MSDFLQKMKPDWSYLDAYKWLATYESCTAPFEKAMPCGRRRTASTKVCEPNELLNILRKLPCPPEHAQQCAEELAAYFHLPPVKLQHDPISAAEARPGVQVNIDVAVAPSSQTAAAGVFTFNGSTLRVLEDVQGKVWLKGVEVAKVLGYQDPNAAIRKHINDDTRRARLQQLQLTTSSFLAKASRADREAWWINEPGIYDLVLACQTSLGDTFRAWLTGEVLPKLRQTGTYSAAEQPQNALCNLEVQRTQLQIELLREQVIEKRLQNRALALENSLKARAYQAKTGLDLTKNQLQHERSVLNRALLPPEQAHDSMVTAAEFLRLQGHTDVDIPHIQGTFGKIMKNAYREATGQDPPTTAFDDGLVRFECAAYNRSTHRLLLQQGYQALTMTEVFKRNAPLPLQMVACRSSL